MVGMGNRFCSGGRARRGPSGWRSIAAFGLLLLGACRGVLGIDPLESEGGEVDPDAGERSPHSDGGTVDGPGGGPGATELDADSDANSETGDGGATRLFRVAPDKKDKTDFVIGATETTDPLTNLTWAHAQPFGSMDHATAIATCAGMGNGYRLPTRYELLSVINYEGSGPALDPTAFPVADTRTHWTASTYAGVAASAWAVAVYYGKPEGWATTEKHWLRCVRGQEIGLSPPGRWVRSQDIVRDTHTGLDWDASESANVNFAGATAHCAQKGPGWRMPQVRELLSLIDDSHASPALDPTAFSGASSDWFWSSTDFATAAHQNWFVSFYDGQTNVSPRNTSTGRVRCVREP